MAKDWWRSMYPSLIGVAGAFFMALIIAVYIMRAPTGDLNALIRFLLVSSLPSLAGGYLLFVIGQRQLRTIRLKVVLAYGLGVTIAIINIYVTSRLMFLNQHDFTLLGLLLVFAGLLSISFGFTMAAGMTESLRILERGVKKLAGGDLSTRVAVPYRDELDNVATAINAMAARLQVASERQRELEQARRHLIAAVSHDLRTPLASVRAMVEALADRVVTDRQTVDRYHATIQTQIAGLSGLIDDLFELSKMESGKLQLQREPANVGDLISDTLESMRPQANVKGVALDGQVSETVPPVLIEAAKIQRVLYNLAQNAIRHTPAGGRIFISARQVEGGVQVDVADTGEGVVAGELSRLFDEFYRSDQSRTRDTGGAGLGLAIARGIVEAHGGTIWAAANPEGGATFSFVLPPAQ
ncbi:MAG: sensor histidine kinase [Anaerolineae bacterium]